MARDQLTLLARGRGHFSRLTPVARHVGSGGLTVGGERSEVTAGSHPSERQKRGGSLQMYPPILSTHASAACAGGAEQKLEYRLSEVRNGLSKGQGKTQGGGGGWPQGGTKGKK